MIENMDIIQTQDWGLGMRKNILISGPCSAETAEQVMETAKGVQAQGEGIDLLRAGIWKPRTRPNSFEGVGSVGLKWLKDAGNAIDKPICTEVANVKHVYEALRNGVDVMWIGARTTTNPFAVQEIADALEGVNVPVMVKNPVNPDLNLWIGAIERIYRAGIRKIAAIHRGFSAYGESKYRNPPQWQIPIELKRRLPQIQVICDPSHICGKRDLLSKVSQRSYDLNFDGLMLESHPNPEKALSDAKQQVTPENLGKLMAGLVKRDVASDDPIFRSQLEDLRHDIDELDEDLILMLAKRMDIVKKIGQYKKENNITIYQSSRWNEIVNDRVRRSASKGLSEDVIKEIFQMIHKESIRHQTAVMNSVEEKA